MEKTNEHWNLHQDRKAAGHRADASVLIDLLHFLRGASLILAVLRADFLHLGLDFLHLARRSNLAHGGLDHERLQRPGQQHDGQNPRNAPCGIHYEG